MTDEETEPAPMDVGADVVLADDLGKPVTDHAMPDTADAQAPGVAANAGKEQREVGEAQPVITARTRRDQRPRAPVLDLDLFTYNDVRFEDLFRAVHEGGQPIALIQPSFGPFILPLMPSGVVLVQDDADSESQEVRDFDVISIRDCARRCVCVFFVVEANSSVLYRTAIEKLPGGRKHVLLIKTCSERQGAWERILRAANRKLEVIRPSPQSGVVT